MPVVPDADPTDLDSAGTDAAGPTIPLELVSVEGLADWLEAQDASRRAWVEAAGFAAALGEVLALPGPGGSVEAMLAGWGDARTRGRDRFHLAAAAARLPVGRYTVHPGRVPFDAPVEALGWSLSEYRFDRYRTRGDGPPAPGRVLVAPSGVDAARIRVLVEAAFLTQDLINTPARDLGPVALEAAFRALAGAHDAQVTVLEGLALTEANLPMIAAVGAAAAEAPRLLDLVWGRPDAPKVTLVGKGVCFDTGGLNIKGAASMGLMKKDMGGAATAMGLAAMVMGLGLDLRLRVLVPAVENAISAAAMRPGDILTSRKGLSVEVNNTDAEGRLVLADALALACEETPALVVSLATLTGAARVALGPDLPPFFTDDDALAGALAAAATSVADPMWRLPFWDPYEPLIEPGIADLDNAPSGGMAGAVTAALFLRRFVEPDCPYLHVDLYGWTPVAKPARPKGGACQAGRAILALLETRLCPS